MSRRNERVFLVRMWLERETPQRGDWRGSIHDVATGRKRYVTAPSEVADFIAIGLADVAESDEAPAE